MMDDGCLLHKFKKSFDASRLFNKQKKDSDLVTMFLSLNYQWQRNLTNFHF